nr:MAG TPA: hypothetical protein [Caudoviricetes sp.]
MFYLLTNISSKYIFVIYYILSNIYIFVRYPTKVYILL